MNRVLALAAVVLIALITAPTVAFAAAKPPLKDISAPGGIGATRASFFLIYGPAVSDSFDDLSKKQHTDDAKYHFAKNDIDIDVLFVVNSDNKERAQDRAYDMIITAPAGSSWSLVDAGIVATLVLPKDAKAKGDLAPVPNVATEGFDWEEQVFTSAFIAKAIPAKNWYVDDKVGQITVSLVPDSPGVYSQITVGTDVN